MFEPSFCAYIFGHRNSGKSYLLIQLLLSKHLNGKFNEIVIINPTKCYDEKYNVIKFSLEYDEFSTELLDELIVHFEEERTKNPEYKVLLILDDCISQDNFKDNQAHHPLNTLAVNGRHWGVSLLILSQKWNAISTYIRTQLDYIIVFETRNMSEIDSMYKEFGQDTKENFRRFFQSIFTKKHDFLVIDNVHKVYMKNFRVIE